MTNTNIIIEKIYSEFLALNELTINYNPTITENEFMLQIEFRGLDSRKMLEKLMQLQYFEALSDSGSPSFLIQKLDSSSLQFSIEEVQKIRWRIQYEKSTENEYVQNLDYYYFLPDKAIELLTNNHFDSQEEKILLGLYNVDSFETPIFKFINLLTETDFNFEKTLNDDILTPVNRLLTNTDQKFNLYNNVYSFMIVNPNLECSFQQAIIREYYKSFFKLLSYKHDDDQYDIRGNKKIIILVDENFSISNYVIFINLVDFLFKDERFLEKYIIIKNVFTRYVHDKESITSLNTKIIEINKTTKYYFEKYVQEDLNDFFKNRDTVYKEAINISKSINEQNDKINTYINASLISFLILAVSFLLKNVSALSITNLIVANVSLLVFSFAFYSFISNSTKERYRTTESQFMLFLDKMGIILSDEKEELIDTYLETPYNDLLKSLSRVQDLLVYSNIILICITLISVGVYLASK
ncbi:hypothetical protein [Psychrobacillus sp.]|uniref:hypothetical protein n=1 Tax=Psychrobacillus sp. TaxID=1871623 RepID=UPI0028BEF739|nr:hypothetical protein [Psychrobacillus sp.]